MKSLFTCYFSVSCFFLLAQSGVYLGFNVSENQDYLFLQSEQNVTRLPNTSFRKNQNSYELNVGYQFNNLYHVETGIMIKSLYNLLLPIQFNNGYEAILSESSRSTFQIPIRFRTKINLYQNRFHLSPVLGYSFDYNRSHRSTGFGRRTTSVNDVETRSFTTSDYGLEKTFGLFETGLGLDIKLYKELSGNIQATYFGAFGKPISKTDHTYVFEDASESNFTTFTNGSYAAVSVGVKYLIRKK